MLELMLCALLTVFPDYLVRRFGQKKRIGKEITLYSVWYELRYGLVACLMLTVSLITLIFYFHPATASAASFYRTVPILPEGSGRVAEVLVGTSDVVVAGQPIFRLDSSEQEAALELARRRITEVDAEIGAARTQLLAADGTIQQVEGALQQAVDEFETMAELRRRNASTVAAREVERREVAVQAQEGALIAARAAKDEVSARIATVLPAQRASAEAELAQAQVEFDKTVVRAGVDGRVAQFVLRVGDVVNPLMRPAGILVPAGAGRRMIVAGFGQIEAQVLKVGMIAEAVCVSLPFTVIPLVVTEVQDQIAAGQVRPTDVLIDASQLRQPGTLTVFLESAWGPDLNNIPPGSSCIVNAYTSNHDKLQDENLSIGLWLFYHVVDTVGFVHALLLRIQALVIPIQTLVLTGH